MEKLADSLQRLGEEDLLQVVEMIHNNKTAETYTKNEVERKSTASIINAPPAELIVSAEGEFHVDLYTLPDNLVRMLWEFCVEKLGS